MANENQSGHVVAGYYVAALIDILGQQEELDKIRSLASAPEQKSEVEKLTTACCKRLNLVRSLFTQGCKIRTTNAPPQVDLTDGQQKDLNAINVFEAAKFQGFSDTVIAYTRVKNRDDELTVQAVDAFLGGCAFTMLMCLAERLPIRGAIDVDFGFNCFDREIYGPVLESVHKLEHDIAAYSRIVVGQSLLDYLSRFDVTDPQASLADKYNAAIATSCRKLIQLDLDGVLILDYAGPLVQQRLRAWPEMNDTLKKARDFARQEHRKFVSSGDRKLALRYALLEGYLNSRIQN